MPRESQQEKRSRMSQIIALLEAAYPDAHCELNFASPLELLIATMLSAQCTDKQVNIVTSELFKKYRTAMDYAQADPVQLQRDIKRIGLFRNKSKSLQACCRKLVDRHGGEVPASMEKLLELDGVGRKTANVVLGNAFQVNHGVVVDTHVARLAHRLRFSNESAPEKIEHVLQRLVPKTKWTFFSHLLIWHGRRRCFARSPDCPKCELQTLCPSAGRIRDR